MYSLRKLWIIIRINRVWLVHLLFLLALAACVEQPTSISQPINEPTERILVTPTKIVSTPVEKEYPTPVPTETSTPQSSPTPTIAIEADVRIAAPDFWVKPLTRALYTLDQEGSYNWTLVSENSAADLILAAGEGEYAAGDIPVALTVPFSTLFDDLTLDQAQTILDEGHDLVAAIELPNLDPKVRALKVDGKTPFDPEYPLYNRWSIIPEAGFEDAADALSLALESTDPAFKTVKINAVGDIMLDRSLGYMIDRGEISYPFSETRDILSAADLTMGNLESSLGNTGQPELKSYTFQAPPEAAQSLHEAGFDVLSLANNHAMDYGPDALRQGIGLLEEQGIATVGAGENTDYAREPHYVDLNSIVVAILGFVDVPIEGGGFDTKSWSAGPDSPGLTWADPAIIENDVVEAAKQADVVIVQLHSGYEYIEQPSPEQSRAARAAIDAGADLVIGHHSHLLQGIEFYNNGVIVYGLGNFAFEIDGDPNTAILSIWLNESGVLQLEIIPAIVQFGGQPRLANPSERSEILQTITRLTRLLNP